MRGWGRWLVLSAVVCLRDHRGREWGPPAEREQASTVHTERRRRRRRPERLGRDPTHDPRKRDTDGDRLNDGAEVNGSTPTRAKRTPTATVSRTATRSSATTPTRANGTPIAMACRTATRSSATTPTRAKRTPTATGSVTGARSTGTRRIRAKRTPTATASGTATRSPVQDEPTESGHRQRRVRRPSRAARRHEPPQRPEPPRLPRCKQHRCSRGNIAEADRRVHRSHEQRRV